MRVMMKAMRVCIEDFVGVGIKLFNDNLINLASIDFEVAKAREDISRGKTRGLHH